MSIMGGFGAMDHMNKSYKQNRELLKKKRVFETLKHYKKWTFSSRRKKSTFKKATPELLAKIRMENKRRNTRNFLISAFALITSISIVLVLANWLLGLDLPRF